MNFVSELGLPATPGQEWLEMAIEQRSEGSQVCGLRVFKPATANDTASDCVSTLYYVFPEKPVIGLMSTELQALLRGICASFNIIRAGSENVQELEAGEGPNATIQWEAYGKTRVGCLDVRERLVQPVSDVPKRLQVANIVGTSITRLRMLPGIEWIETALGAESGLVDDARPIILSTTQPAAA